MKRWHWVLGAAVFFSACAHTRSVPLSTAEVHLKVPFFPQTSDQCGPSSLASLLGFWGNPVPPEQLKKEIYLKKLKGSLPMDILFAAQDHGLSADIKNSTIEALKEELREGRPSIAFLNLGYRFMPIGHYVVMTGFNKDGFFGHSAGHLDQYFSFADFSSKWDKTERWLLVARPKPKDALGAQ